jgi:hypothetical protein
MNVEDSYEGAVRRLRRLEHAGYAALTPPPQDRADDEARMAELEELATLACDENERLKGELDEARAQIVRLQHMVATLQAAVSEPDESFGVGKRSGRGAGFYFFVILLLGGGAIALVNFRPWERAMRRLPVAAASVDPVVLTPPPPAPVLTAPAPVVTAPVVTAPVIPKAAPIVPKVVAPPAAPARHERAAKHHSHRSRHEAKKHHAAASSSKAGISDTDDPLGGTNL